MNKAELQPGSYTPQKNNGSLLLKFKSKKQIVVTLLIVILLIGGAFVVIKNNNRQTAIDDLYKSQGESREEEEASKPLTDEETFLIGAKNSAEVKVTKSGFSPMVITVKVDTKVTWTTDDNNSYGIAANAGSKTTKFFGSKQNIDLHTLYYARFDKEGTYTYHDTTNPKNNGTIFVTK